MLAYQNAGMRSLAVGKFTYGAEATARSSLPYILTQLLQRDTLQVGYIYIRAPHKDVVQLQRFKLLLRYIIKCVRTSHALQGPFQAAFAVRPLTAAATPDPRAGNGSKQQQQAASKDGKDALTVDQEEFDAITSQIPQRPMGVVEGTSYTVIIIAGIAMAGVYLSCSIFIKAPSLALTRLLMP